MRLVGRCSAGRDDPIAAPRLAALGKDAGDIDRAALAGAGALDRPVLRVHAAHPHLDRRAG